MLFHPLEEKFHSPSVFVEQSHLLGCDLKVVSVKDKCPVAVMVIENHTAKLDRIC